MGHLLKSWLSRTSSGWQLWLIAWALALATTQALACQAAGGPAGRIDLASKEARDPRWLRKQFEALLPCRDTSSQLACMCRPIIDVDVLLPSDALVRGKGRKGAKAALENRRRFQSLRRALHAVGDVGAVQMRVEYRINSAGKIILTRPAELREARRVLRSIAPREAGQTVTSVAPPKGRRGTAARQHVVRITFV